MIGVSRPALVGWGYSTNFRSGAQGKIQSLVNQGWKADPFFVHLLAQRLIGMKLSYYSFRVFLYSTADQFG